MNKKYENLPIMTDIKSPLFMGARVELNLKNSAKWMFHKSLLEQYGYYVSGLVHNADSNVLYGARIKTDVFDEKNKSILGIVVGRVTVNDSDSRKDFKHLEFADVVDKPYEDYDINELQTTIIYVNNQLDKLRKINEGNHRFSVVPNVDLEDVHGWINKIAPLFRRDTEQIFLANTALERLQFVATAIKLEVEYQKYLMEFHEKVEESMQENQKEYFLREQLKVIHEELYGSESEIEEYENKIKALPAPKTVTDVLDKELRKLANTQSTSPESYVIRNYLDTVLSLPWDIYSKENQSLQYAKKVLDEDHYGIEKVKERILEFLAVRKLAPDRKGNIICFVGPPGVGKTSIVRSIAKALGREYIRTSLGGMHDEAEIRGHRKTYIGSKVGRIISCINTVGTMNPVFLLDEIDKLSKDYKGDPASALLEVLDPEQNKTFQDNYLELPFDLSKVLFITTANNKSSIAPPLLDRMEIIDMGGYMVEEKIEIAKRHLLPKQLKEHGIKPNRIVLSDKILEYIIANYTREAGVRRLEQCLATLCRKVAVGYTKTKQPQVTVNFEDINEYLGKPKYFADDTRKEPAVGIITGLVWTEYGGATMEIECLLMKGKGGLTLTGNLGKIMKESARTAMSLSRFLADKYEISDNAIRDANIHIHTPEAAIPKDGPSAGIALTASMLSAFIQRPIRCDIAVTGEVTLTGRVLAIGGVKQKCMGAIRAGITNIVLPKQNQNCVAELPESIREKLNFIYVEDINEALAELFV